MPKAEKEVSDQKVEEEKMDLQKRFDSLEQEHTRLQGQMAEKLQQLQTDNIELMEKTCPGYSNWTRSCAKLAGLP